MQNLTPHEGFHRHDVMIKLNQQVMGGCNGAQTRTERRAEIIHCVSGPGGLPRDGLDRRQRIFDPVAELPYQKLAVLFRKLAFANVHTGWDELGYLSSSVEHRGDLKIDPEPLVTDDSDFGIITHPFAVGGCGNRVFQPVLRGLIDVPPIAVPERTPD